MALTILLHLFKNLMRLVKCDPVEVRMDFKVSTFYHVGVYSG